MIDRFHTASQRRLRVFLCHSSDDKPAVRKLYQQLQAEGIDPWLDEKNLLPGQIWENEIRKAVQATDVVIVCLSPGSISKTGFVQKEIKFALDVADEQPEGTIFLIPVKLEECEIPERLRHLQWVNLFEENGYEHLIRALRKRAAELGLPLRKKRLTSVKTPPSQSSFPTGETASENQAPFPTKSTLPSKPSAVLPDLQPSAVPPAEMPPAGPPHRGISRRKFVVGLAGLAVVGVAGGGLLWLTRSSPSPQSRIGTINLQLMCQHCEQPGFVAFIKSYSIDPTGSTSLTITFTNHTNSAVDMKVDTIKLLDQSGNLIPILSSDPFIGVSAGQTVPTIINFSFTPQPGTKYTFSIVMEEPNVFVNFYQSPFSFA